MTDILAVADHRRGDLRDVSYELITAGRELADETGGDLHLAVISGTVDDFADKLTREGVDAIHTVSHGEEFNHDVYAQAVTQLYDDHAPQYVLTPNSVNGLDYAPAVANALDLPVVTDTIALEADGETLTATREMYGGKVETTTQLEGDAVVTIRGAEWPAAEGTGDATIDAFDAAIDEDAVGSTVTGFEEAGGGDVDISEADVLVSIGRGIEEEENLDLIRELADALDATLDLPQEMRHPIEEFLRESDSVERIEILAWNVTQGPVEYVLTRVDGAIETATVMACVEQGLWPASAGFAEPDSDPPGIAPLTRALPVHDGCFLLNFFGFGGNNCALVLGYPR